MCDLNALSAFVVLKDNAGNKLALSCSHSVSLLMATTLQVCGKPVGVHISRGRSVDQLVEDQMSEMQDDSDPDASVNKLLRLLRSHSDKKAATAAALKAVLTLPSRKVTPAEEAALERSPPPIVEPIEPIPDPDSFLDSFPRCKHLVETFRANPSTHNKTPLAILHEYATRLGLEVRSNRTFYVFGCICYIRLLHDFMW